MKINATWHTKNPMPPRATMAQRITWHQAHAKHCACRPIPESVQAAIQASVSDNDHARSPRDGG
ncbi:MAG: hypothetical protein K0S86_4411 [Geminicoccaceae bacterium]|jgi:hypothetical protein|nr:hypothetical protein [Geminicoccaceae bacterium]